MIQPSFKRCSVTSKTGKRICCVFTAINHFFYFQLFWRLWTSRGMRVKPDTLPSDERFMKHHAKLPTRWRRGVDCAVLPVASYYMQMCLNVWLSGHWICMSKLVCVCVSACVCVCARHCISVCKNNVPSRRNSKWMSPGGPQGLVKIAQRLIRSEAARRF